jgi:DNA-3-methyladenine glycosylase
LAARSAAAPELRARRLLDRPGLEVAPLLLGAVLTSLAPDGEVAVRLSEVEAYEGMADPGSHAFRGPSRRNQVMFGGSGHLYVYRHLGLHHCINVVCTPVGTASAVLLRAGEVVDGADLARARRTLAGVCRGDVDLARGPARLAVALGLSAADNGTDLFGAERRVLLLLPAEPVGADAVRTGGRVGVSGPGGDAAVHPWRFWIAGDPTVSAYRRAG